jgi:16S rRNA (cytosine1402-N4)-methyltransferase
MVREVLQALRPGPGAVCVDCTLGYGGHARRLLEATAPDGVLLGLDVDSAALAAGGGRLKKAFGPRVRLERTNYSRLAEAMDAHGLERADVILADLGLSSMQIDDPARGLHYKHDGPLDLRMDDRIGRPASQVLAEIARDDLAALLREYGDEEDADRIADWIVNQRRAKPVETTGELNRLVLNAKGHVERPRRKAAWNPYGASHPSAKVFQALRIFVNDEMGHLERFLRAVGDRLVPGGRLAVISFHGGEDRRVRQGLQRGLDEGVYASISEKARRPGAGEVRRNSRSHSARLRWAVRSEP